MFQHEGLFMLHRAINIFHTDPETAQFKIPWSTSERQSSEKERNIGDKWIPRETFYQIVGRMQVDAVLHSLVVCVGLPAHGVVSYFSVINCILTYKKLCSNLNLISNYSEVARYKVNVQKSVSFLYYQQQIIGIWNWKHNTIYTSIHNLKHLGINLSKIYTKSMWGKLQKLSWSRCKNN